MGVKKLLKKNHVIYSTYKKLKKKWLNMEFRQRTRFKGKFIDRSHGHEKLCIVLAGYKEALYPAVFGRLKKFKPDDVDMCVISSGLHSDELDKICADNGWSYLSTKRNCVTLAQNVAINLHPKAKYIYKLDEDIFITEHYFENMMRALEHAWGGVYAPGVIAPIIPVNGYGYVRVVEKLGIQKEYMQRFGDIKCCKQDETSPVFVDSECPKFLWGKDGVVPSIDDMNSMFSKNQIEERPCPIRFSIGAILFERELWRDMNGFYVPHTGWGMGKDEMQICPFCMMQARPLMVSENVVAGHLSFGKQSEDMLKFFEENPRFFAGGDDS